MTKAVRKGKQNRHEKITVVLMSGKIVTVEELKSVFTGKDLDQVLYRLPQNICSIKCDGGIVKVFKEGRKVTAYQLMNSQEFNDMGRYIGPVAKIAPAVAPAEPEPTVQAVEIQETELLAA